VYPAPRIRISVIVLPFVSVLIHTRRKQRRDS
jgi:hypothetical protein